MKIFVATRHMSLRAAVDALTSETVESGVRESYTALEVFGRDRSGLAVAALHPHGG